MKRHLRVVGASDQTAEQRLDEIELAFKQTWSSLEARLDKALDTELHGALQQLEQSIKTELRSFRARQSGNLAEDINSLLSLLDRPRAPVRVLFGIDTDDYGYDAVFAERMHSLVDFVFQRLFRVEGRIDGSVSAGLLVAKRAHPVDGIMLSHALMGTRPLLANRWFDAPVLGTLLNRMGGVRACPENTARMLGEGRLVFAELDASVVRVALQQQAPIMTVSIVGALPRVLRLSTPLHYRNDADPLFVTDALRAQLQ